MVRIRNMVESTSGIFISRIPGSTKIHFVSLTIHFLNFQ